MSNKHLKKLHGAKDELSELVSTLQMLNGEEEGEDSDQNEAFSSNKKKKPAANLFDLVKKFCPKFIIWFLYHLIFLQQLNEGDDASAEDDTSPAILDSDDEKIEIEVKVALPQTGAKPKKGKGKKKKKQQQIDVNQEQEDLEDEDFFLAQAQSLNGHPGFSPTKTKPSAPTKNVLSLEQKSLNAENELKKIFGSRVVKAGQKNKKARGRAYVKSTWLINAKDNWSQIRKTGNWLYCFSRLNDYLLIYF